MANWRDVLGYIQNSTVFGPLLQSRSDLMAKTGTTFGGNRKHYEAFGWPVAVDYNYWEHLYRRGGIAKRVVNAYPQATWRQAPLVTDGDGAEETQFEKAWKELCKQRQVFHYLERGDRLARLGTFSVLFLGYSDGSDWDRLKDPVGMVAGANPWDKLLYLQPYGQDKVQISTWVEDPKDSRFGFPLLYQIQLNSPTMGGTSVRAATRTIVVHWTRVLHIAEDILESDVEGDPCLQSILNYLLDLEKVHGAAAEAFYQQSPPLTIFNADKDANIDATTFSDDDLGDQVEAFINGYKRWLATQGMNVTSLSPQLGDPSQVKEMLLELIAGTTGIPKRILVGSERGELASTQDETAWNSRVEERQLNWAEPMVLRPFIDEMIAKGVLPVPSSEEYQVQWQGNQSISEEAQATIAQARSSALSAYAGAMGAQEIMPPDIFLESILGLDQETIEKIKETRQELWDKELEDLLKDEETLAEEERTRREIVGDLPIEGETGSESSPFAHKKAGGGKKTTAKGGGKPFLESEHPRARQGQFREKGAGLSDKAKKAKDSHVTATREMQRAAIKNEKDLAKRIGAKHMPDNESFDVHVGGKHLLEVKTIIVGKHDKITMRKECRERKLAMAAEKGATAHTVVFDNRSGNVYYSKGVGSFRLGGMEKIGTMSTYGTKLKARIKGEET
jgi:hypothetical protein